MEIESCNKAKKSKSALGESKMLKKLHSGEKPRRFISGQSVSGSGSFSTELGHLDRVWGLQSSGPESETLVITSFERFSPFVVLEMPSLCKQSFTVDNRSGPKKLSVEILDLK